MNRTIGRVRGRLVPLVVGLILAPAIIVADTKPASKPSKASFRWCPWRIERGSNDRRGDETSAPRRMGFGAANPHGDHALAPWRRNFVTPPENRQNRPFNAPGTPPRSTSSGVGSNEDSWRRPVTPTRSHSPRPRTRCRGKRVRVLPAAWSPPWSRPARSAVSALAVSPAAPIVTVSRHKQVLVFDWKARKLLGALAFPEGDVFAPRFSRDGRSLLAAGGFGAESGRAVLFETTTWARTASIGDETRRGPRRRTEPGHDPGRAGRTEPRRQGVLQPRRRGPSYPSQADRLGDRRRFQPRRTAHGRGRSLRRSLPLGDPLRPGIPDAPGPYQGHQRDRLARQDRQSRDGRGRRHHPGLGPPHRQALLPMGCAPGGCARRGRPPVRPDCLGRPRPPSQGLGARRPAHRRPRTYGRSGHARRLDRRRPFAGLRRRLGRAPPLEPGGLDFESDAVACGLQARDGRSG